jgi:hypothetical protein
MLTLAASSALTASPASAHVPWPRPPHQRSSCSTRPAPALCRLHWFVRRTWGLQDARGLHRSHYWWTAERNPARAPWLARREAWRARARRVAAIPIAPWPPWWLSDALCIHRGEGAWNDPNAPYWGGLQMDASFMATYGPAYLARWGTADHWPPRDQLIAAWRAYQTRGFTPWPNTAAACGLL